MRSFVRNIYASPGYAKALTWGRLVTITGFAQILIQGIGLISGIIVIHLLPTQEYAFYTLANTMVGTIIIIADGGVATGVMANGGRTWQSRELLGATIATGLDLRRKFATVVLVIAIPVLILLLHHHSASWLMSAAIVFALIPTFLASMSGTLLEIAPRLHQDIAPIQKIEVGSNIGRIAMLGGTLFLFPWAFVAILSAGLPQALANIRLRRLSNIHADLSQKPSPAIRKEIIPIVKRVLPGAIYYCISGQITIWLISIFGSTESIAQVGALGRLAVVLNLFSTMFNTLVVPRFARLANNRTLILKYFFQAQALLVLISTVVISGIVVFPTQALAVLGNKYSGLTTEVILITISSCISLAAGITYAISIARGWILIPAINISVNILTQLTLVYFLDLSSTQNVLLFSIVSAAVSYLMLVAYFIYKCFQKEQSSDKATLQTTSFAVSH